MKVEIIESWVIRIRMASERASERWTKTERGRERESKCEGERESCLAQGWRGDSPGSRVQHSTAPAELYRNNSCDYLRNGQAKRIGGATQVSGS